MFELQKASGHSRTLNRIIFTELKLTNGWSATLSSHIIDAYPEPCTTGPGQ